MKHWLKSKILIKSKILWHKIKPQKGPHDINSFEFLKKNNEASHVMYLEIRPSVLLWRREDRFHGTAGLTRPFTATLTSHYIISISRTTSLGWKISAIYVVMTAQIFCQTRLWKSGAIFASIFNCNCVLNFCILSQSIWNPQLHAFLRSLCVTFWW